MDISLNRERLNGCCGRVENIELGDGFHIARLL